MVKNHLTPKICQRKFDRVKASLKGYGNKKYS